jgi:hypothetical protein
MSERDGAPDRWRQWGDAGAQSAYCGTVWAHPYLVIRPA